MRPRRIAAQGLALAILLALGNACFGAGRKPPEAATPSPAVETAPASVASSRTPSPAPTAAPQPAISLQQLAYVDHDRIVWLTNEDGSGKRKLFEGRRFPQLSWLTSEKSSAIIALST